MLHISDLVVRYGSAVALDGVSLDVGRGEMVALVGPNGAGKSTLINTVSGVLTPASGSVVLEGTVAQVPEGRQMFPDMSVEDNLLLGGWSIRNRQLDEVFDLLPDLAGMRRRKAGRLSGGQQQMVAIGRALMARPDLLAIDELSLGLAPIVVAELAEHLRYLNTERGTAILLVEQEVTLAFDLCARACVLEAGRVVVTGTTAELAESDAVRKAYFGELAELRGAPMNEFVTYLVTGIALGSSFALIGSGFVVVHRVTRVVNFAQGSLAVLGAMLSASLLAGRLPHVVGEAVTVVVCGAVGVLVGVIAIGRRGTPPLISLIVTLGVSMLFSAAIIWLWGQDPVSPPGLDGFATVLGAEVERQRLLVLVVTLVAFAALSLFFSRSYLGKALTASASNPYAARLVGIDVRRMGLVAFGLSGVLGGLAGVLIAPSNALSFYSDLPMALGGFAAAVFGGLVSPLRTLVGGLGLGVAGQLTAGYLNGSYQTEVALLLMMVIMIARSRSFALEEAK